MVSMTKDGRKCSHCGHNGHNSRTCNSKGVGGIKLFGVRIDDYGNTKMKMLKNGDHESIRRSKSLGNLEHAANYDNNGAVESGYLSDGIIHSQRNRRKGTSWTEEEHRCFLIGLEKLGKGDWRGISKNYVPSRTPTQVASHAQKYYIRMASNDKKKRRPSVFDVHLVNSPLEQLFDTCQIKGQASKSGPCATRERPPLSPSPINRPFGVHMPYMMGVARNVKVARPPTISWIPVVNFHNYSQGPPHQVQSQIRML